MNSRIRSFRAKRMRAPLRNSLGGSSGGSTFCRCPRRSNGLLKGDLPARPAVITFDDGYADNRTVALPILQAHGLTATFFVATGFLDGGRMWNDTRDRDRSPCPGPGARPDADRAGRLSGRHGRAAPGRHSRADPAR